MKLTRALPAFLALSLLTGCDINAFLPQTPGDTGNKPGPSTSDQTNEEAIKTLNTYKDSIMDALAQGSTVAGAVNLLKSVSAFTSGGSAYRISAMNWPENADIQWDEVDESHPHYDTLQNRFAGFMGTSDEPKGWYLDGEFSFPLGPTAVGSASIVTNGVEVDFNNMDELEATVQVELDVKEAPEGQKAIFQDVENTHIEMTLTKPAGTVQDYIEGPFTLVKDGETSTGTIEINLMTQAWTIDIYSKDSNGKSIIIRLSNDESGSGVARIIESPQPATPNQPPTFAPAPGGAITIPYTGFVPGETVRFSLAGENANGATLAYRTRASR